MSSQKRAQTRRRDGSRKQSNRPPMTSGQLADLINGMPRAERLDLADDLENIAAALLRFAKLVRK
jgi:hypothetical protein